MTGRQLQRFAPPPVAVTLFARTGTGDPDVDFQVRVRSCVSAGRATLAVFHRYADGVCVIRDRCHAVGLAAPYAWDEDTSAVHAGNDTGESVRAGWPHRRNGS